MSRYAITKQIPPLASPGTRSSHINRAFNAALAELLGRGDGKWYAQLYQKYMNIEPRFRPTTDQCDQWSDVDAKDEGLQRIVSSGKLRFGYCAGEPYVYLVDGSLVGFDFELAGAVTQTMSEHFFGQPDRLSATWTEVKLSSDEQADKLTALYQGLVDGDFDIALAGQMMLPSQYLGGLPIEWTAPTAMLFTAITYTGRHRDVIDLAWLEKLRSTDLEDFQAFAIDESKRLNLELRIFSVVNPGPSPGAAQGLVYAINHKGGRSIWDCGDIADSGRVMWQAADHIAVGDSLASGAQTKNEAFKGIYLNIPATNELWPIAGFTAGVQATTQPEIAVYAEHSDSMKPMTLDPDPALTEQQRGWNVRVFNRTEVHRANAIHLEQGTGVVTLGAGLYHITAVSIVAFDNGLVLGQVSPFIQPFIGYARLRDADKYGCMNEEAIAIGSMSTTSFVPSLIDTYFEVKDQARIVLEHQIGDGVANTWLEGTWTGSHWHVMARITIQRV